MSNPGRVLILIVLIAMAFCCATRAEENLEDVSKKREAAKRAVYAKLPPADEAGFERLGEPRNGVWMSLFEEIPQNLDDFKTSKPVRATPERYQIVLQPLGKLEPGQSELLDAMKEYVAAFYQLPARVAPPLDLEVSDKKVRLTRLVTVDRFTRRAEYDATKILDEILLKNLPAEAAVDLGIANVDLFAGAAVVHGWTSLDQRVGVISFSRFWPKSMKASDAETFRRACRFVSHEIGHAFGLTHCVFYRCPMNGCSNLAESDTSPLHFCPVCQQKLQWLLGVDAQNRYSALNAFYTRHGMKEEAEWTAKRLQK